MNRVNRFLSESRALGGLALPIILSQLAYVMLGLIDTVMAGQAGAVEQAAVALGVAFWIPVFITLMSIVQAVSPLVAHHFGAGDHAGIVADTREGMWLGALSSLLPFALMPAVRPIMLWAEIDPLLIEKTVRFLWGIVFGLPAALVFRALSFYSASINRPQPMMVLAFIGLGVNTLLNWLLIWGHWGFPALGGAGCGWATGIGMWVALIGLLLWTAYAPGYRPYYLWHGWSWPHWARQRRLLKIGLPMGGAALAEVGAFCSVAILIGRFGAEQIAAHQVAMNFSSLIFMLPMGVASAITIRVGQLLGAGEPRQARFVAWSGVLIGLVIGLLALPLIAFGRESIVAIYSPDLRVRELAMTLMLFAMAWQLSDAAQVTAIGALRAYKITVLPMCLMFFAFWVVGLPLGTWLGYRGLAGSAPLGVFGFWIGLLSGLSLVALGLLLTLRHNARVTVARMQA